MALACAPACGVLSPEEQLLSDFFQAARLRDMTMAARVSSADVNVLAGAVVEQFEVVPPDGADRDGDRRVVTVATLVRRPDGVSETRNLTAIFERTPARRWRLARLER